MKVEVIIAAILGGMGTIVGAAIGGMFLVLFRDFRSGLAWTVPGIGVPVTDIDFLLFALGTLVLLFVMPCGALRWAIRNGRRARMYVADVTADGGHDADEALRGTVPGETERSPLESVYEDWREELGRWRP